MGVFRVEMLPAAEGDALLIEWGRRSRPHRMLVDGGPLTTYKALHDRIAALGSRPRLDLVVVTHVDGDHIEGVIRLLQDRRALRLEIADVWFNGWEQLPASDLQGAKYGEMVGALLARDGLPWNRRPDPGCAIAIPDRGPLPTCDLAGGARLTVLGPGVPQLRRLKAEWVSALADEEGIRPGDVDAALKALAADRRLRGLGGRDVQGRFRPDSSVANLSSICLLMEYDDRAVLLTGDSHSAPLVAAINRLLAERDEQALHVDAFKLPHHCSRANVSDELVALVDTPRYLVSTSGARHEHPDREAVLRVLQAPHETGDIELVFNYASKTTEPWGGHDRISRYGYRPVFPTDPANGVVVNL